LLGRRNTSPDKYKSDSVAQIKVDEDADEEIKTHDSQIDIEEVIIKTNIPFEF
jgi:hypothetical protein